MSADVLREAAALMRARADLALNEWGVDRWRVSLSEFNAPEDRDTYVSNPVWMKNHVATDDVHGSVILTSPWQDTGCATHAASWHPAVALAVADWLDREADLFERLETLRLEVSKKGFEMSWGESTQDEALAVARIYLNDNTDTSRGN